MTIPNPLKMLGMNGTYYGPFLQSGPLALKPASYVRSPGYAKQLLLGTSSCNRVGAWYYGGSLTFRSRTLIPTVYKITASGLPEPFNAHQEFGDTLVFYAQGIAGAPDYLTDEWYNYAGPYPGIYPNRFGFPYWDWAATGGGQPQPVWQGYGCATSISLTDAGTGYPDPSTYAPWSFNGPVALTGGHGSGATIFYASSGPVGGPFSVSWIGYDGATPNTGQSWCQIGSGYQVGDVLTISGGSATVTVTGIDTYPYPSWKLQQLAYPHVGSGVADPGYTGPPTGKTPDTYDILVTCSLNAALYGHTITWGLQGLPLNRPWPDVMSLNGKTLPFISQGYEGYGPPLEGGPWMWTPGAAPAALDNLSLVQRSFAGSSVSIQRVPKPAYPYLGNQGPGGVWP